MFFGSGTKETERRGDDRVECFSSVTVTAVTELMAGAGADVSRHGIYVITPDDLPDGSLVDISFPLHPNGDSFRAVGEIQWRQHQPVGDDVRWGLGIEFAYATLDNRAALCNYLKRCADETSRHWPESLPEGLELGARAPVPEGERRESDRFPVANRVLLKTVTKLTQGTVCDLSMSGMQFVSNRAFDVGGIVDLEFTPEGRDREFALLGQVRWHKPESYGDTESYAHGVEFLDVRTTNRDALEEFVDERRGADTQPAPERMPDAPVF